MEAVSSASLFTKMIPLKGSSNNRQKIALVMKNRLRRCMGTSPSGLTQCKMPSLNIRIHLVATCGISLKSRDTSDSFQRTIPTKQMLSRSCVPDGSKTLRSCMATSSLRRGIRRSSESTDRPYPISSAISSEDCLLTGVTSISSSERTLKITSSFVSA